MLANVCSEPVNSMMEFKTASPNNLQSTLQLHKRWVYSKETKYKAYTFTSFLTQGHVSNHDHHIYKRPHHLPCYASGEKSGKSLEKK